MLIICVGMSLGLTCQQNMNTLVELGARVEHLTWIRDNLIRYGVKVFYNMEVGFKFTAK